MSVKWFGRMYTAPMYLDTEETATPVGALCCYCDEAIEQGDDGWLDAGGKPHHRACWIRMIIGSVAHIEKRCDCFVPGAEDHDPPGMTRRQAAEAALRAFELAVL